MSSSDDSDPTSIGVGFVEESSSGSSSPMDTSASLPSPIATDGEEASGDSAPSRGRQASRASTSVGDLRSKLAHIASILTSSDLASLRQEFHTPPEVLLCVPGSDDRAYSHRGDEKRSAQDAASGGGSSGVVPPASSSPPVVIGTKRKGGVDPPSLVRTGPSVILPRTSPPASTPGFAAPPPSEGKGVASAPAGTTADPATSSPLVLAWDLLEGATLATRGVSREWLDLGRLPAERSALRGISDTTLSQSLYQGMASEELEAATVVAAQSSSRVRALEEELRAVRQRHEVELSEAGERAVAAYQRSLEITDYFHQYNQEIYDGGIRDLAVHNLERTPDYDFSGFPEVTILLPETVAVGRVPPEDGAAMTEEGVVTPEESVAPHADADLMSPSGSKAAPPLDAP
ncbi:uncharacterized protein LOC122652008 [Telopea speciosissima]|uniref:uncharacterized protein LOC122652008 n=1 Tax=Telopea speciosissima TaxID=54955 RepID=UPI001CC44C95|nr:uncharacterized protein LOC122652008 [Telopea speciosissima]